jgi:hypothetical protein
MAISEKQVCNEKGQWIGMGKTPEETKAILEQLREKPENIRFVATECANNATPAWHYNHNVFENAQKVSLTAIKRKHDEDICDFSDFMDEEEFERLEKKIATTCPSEVMY